MYSYILTDDLFMSINIYLSDRKKIYKPFLLNNIQTGRCLDDLICLSITDGTKS